LKRAIKCKNFPLSLLLFVLVFELIIIWDIVEIGMEIPNGDDENYNPVEVEKSYTATPKPPWYYLFLSAGKNIIR
jgi:quinol-cytochrome oxidoreductase complex cytochrome b subunit